jgi:hypothetical protein
MESEISELLTRWTVRLAVACYVLRVSFDLTGWGTPWAKRAVLWLWTAGCGLLLTHVICAFQFYHEWSHFAAYENTARQTAEVVGIDWGGGLYFNYLFIGVWMGDVTAWWRLGDAYIERRQVYWFVQVIFAFMIVNATIVFGPPVWKLVAWAVIAGLLLIRMVCRQPRNGVRR